MVVVWVPAEVEVEAGMDVVEPGMLPVSEVLVSVVVCVVLVSDVMVADVLGGTEAV